MKSIHANHCLSVAPVLRITTQIWAWCLSNSRSIWGEVTAQNLDMVSSERGQPLTDSCSPPSHYSYGPRCIYHISMNLHDKSFTSNPPLELPRLRRWYRMDTAERFWLPSVFPRCLFCLLFMTMVIAGFVLLSSFGIAPVVHARGLKMKRPRTKVTQWLTSDQSHCHPVP